MKNISDIAKLAGVSKSTVSRFLNNGSVSPATKEKITKIIEENNYQPNNKKLIKLIQPFGRHTLVWVVNGQ